MTELTEALHHLDNVLNQTASTVANRLQPGLSRVEIDKRTAFLSWVLPQDVYDLYQWHNGLSGISEKLDLAEKFLRLKGKWHGELAGRENEIHLLFKDQPIVAKFLPLEYALAGFSDPEQKGLFDRVEPTIGTPINLTYENEIRMKFLSAYNL